MQFGLTFNFVQPPGSGLTWKEAVDGALACLPEAEALGYSMFDCCEHHFQRDGWNPSPLLTLAAFAARSKRARLGTNVLLVPLYHPVKLAEDLSVLDQLSGGRLTVSVAPGYVSEEFAGMGVAYEERFARFEEALDVIQAAWTGETFSFQGRFFQVPESRLSPKPLQRPHPPLRYGVSGPHLLRRAARRGLPITASPRHTVAELQEQFTAHDQAAKAYGFEILDRPVMRGIFVAETREEAERIAAPGITHQFRELYGRKSAAGERRLRSDAGNEITDAAQVDFEHFRSRYIIGDPEFAREGLELLREKVGLTELHCWMHLPGLSGETAMRSVRLFAEEVMPAFRDPGVTSATPPI